MAEDLSLKLALKVHVDSSTAKSIASRAGVGKVPHLETRRLWAQDAVKTGRFIVEKVRGDRNPAVVFTKPLAHYDMLIKLKLIHASPIRRIRN